ncbi:hypothetical protein K440DRAFT_630674 [Wilcoxina mikolae CBS 423.85]|nr:hypothetical protein K440DRAFT_630674 [Wilcoxina mikolae CBS 423.85]
MSEAYERERQNNALLSELSQKVTALRGVTVDIYDQARDHQVIDSSNEVFASFHTSLKNSAGRIRLMAQNGGKIQTLRLAAMMVGGVVVLYLLWGWFFG